MQFLISSTVTVIFSTVPLKKGLENCTGFSVKLVHVTNKRFMPRRIQEKVIRDMDHRASDMTSPEKKFKIEVLRNGLSEILRQRKRVMCNL